MQRYLTKHIPLLLWGVIALVAFASKAQAQAPNLVPNGNFATPNPSDASRPQGWKDRYRATLHLLQSSTDARPGSKDDRFIRIDTGFWMENSQDDSTPILTPLTQGQDYSFVFWHKSTNGGAKLMLIIRMYDGVSEYHIGQKIINNTIVTEAGEWKQYKTQLKWSGASSNEVSLNPETVSISIGLRKSSYEDDQIYLDDIAVVPVGRESELDNADVPQAIQVPQAKMSNPRSYQREAELSWEQDYPEGDDRSGTFSWELTVGDGDPITLTQPKYTLTNLDPGRSYQVGVRTLYKDGRSALVQQTVQTARLTTNVDDPLRIPYLRLINRDGITPMVLPLYYMELYNKNADCRYWINGQEVDPVGGNLYFPAAGTYDLKVQVQEDDDHVWTLDYNQITVR